MARKPADGSPAAPERPTTRSPRSRAPWPTASATTTSTRWLDTFAEQSALGPGGIETLIERSVAARRLPARVGTLDSCSSSSRSSRASSRSWRRDLPEHLRVRRPGALRATPDAGTPSCSRSSTRIARWTQASQDLDDANEMLAAEADTEMREYLEVGDRREASSWSSELAADIRELLVAARPERGQNVIVEIRGAEGGEEANLWAGDLFRMYQRFAERNGWKLEVLEQQPSDMGGYRDITFVVKGDDAWAPLQVRRRSAPRAAGAGDREPGSDPHERGDGRGAARSRGDRRRHRPERPRDRRVPLDRARRPVGEHHRLGGADHPQAHRPRRHLPGREEPAAEQGQGAAHPSLAPVADRAGAPGREQIARAARAR